MALRRLVRPCADWCGPAQTGAALRRLVQPCADWCGPAQTGAALRRLVRPCADWCGPAQTGADQSANPDATGASHLRSAVELTNFPFSDFPFSMENSYVESHPGIQRSRDTFSGWKTIGCLREINIFWEIKNVHGWGSYGRQTQCSEK